MTMIVGDGRPFLSERVLLNGQLISTNPFVSADGPKWDDPRFNLTGKLPAGALDQPSPPIVSVEPNTLLSDCLTFSAIIFSTTVKDSDGDGIIDIVETSSSLHDPFGFRLPNLAAMGADPLKKDIFVEVGALWVPPGSTVQYRTRNVNSTQSPADAGGGEDGGRRFQGQEHQSAF